MGFIGGGRPCRRGGRGRCIRPSRSRSPTTRPGTSRPAARRTPGGRTASPRPWRPTRSCRSSMLVRTNWMRFLAYSSGSPRSKSWIRGSGLSEQVFVRSEGQLGIGGLGGDLGQFLFLLGLLVDRLIGVFDGPVVVRADGGREVIALLFALGGDVGRQVIHHRAAVAVLGGELGVVDSVERIDAAGLEVVPQAERVADLVHHDFLDRLGEEFFGHFSAGLQFAAGGQDAPPARPTAAACPAPFRTAQAAGPSADAKRVGGPRRAAGTAPARRASRRRSGPTSAAGRSKAGKSAA